MIAGNQWTGDGLRIRNEDDVVQHDKSGLRVLLVDDNLPFLEAATEVLTADGSVEVVAWARSGQQAIELVADKRPHLVLMDLSMWPMNGLEATHRIKTADAPPRVVIVTGYDDSEYRKAAKLAGADDFIAKGQFATDVWRVVGDTRTGIGSDGGPAHSGAAG